MKAFEECGVNPSFYANRKREYDEILPWDHLDYGIRKEFLIDENKKAHMSVTTPIADKSAPPAVQQSLTEENRCKMLESFLKKQV